MPINEKELAGKEAVKYIQSNYTVGLGTGSTAFYFINSLGLAVKNEAIKNIKCVATSFASAKQAKGLGLEVVDLDSISKIDITVDGADEFDSNFNLIKGGGGALVREKIVASFSEKLIIIADSSKQVATLGTFKLPIEVFQFSYLPLLKKLKQKKLSPSLRLVSDGNPFISDNGNYLIDLDLKKIEDPYALKHELNNIPGIIDHGLFLDYTDQIIMGKENQTLIFQK